MKRRAFVAGMAAVIGAPRMTVGQKPQKLHRIGYFLSSHGSSNRRLLAERAS
jgi:hypothetical protein